MHEEIRRNLDDLLYIYLPTQVGAVHPSSIHRISTLLRQRLPLNGRATAVCASFDGGLQPAPV